jgi:hypothetical protein
MGGSIVRGAVAAGALLLGTVAPAGDEALPPPRPVNPPVAVLPAPPVYPLYTPPLSRDVWRLYDVGRTTLIWRPRVIMSPYGDYYQYNHASYPWAELYPHWYKGRLVTE